jgi:predicted transcriptional regulator
MTLLKVNKKRSDIEILADILKVALTGAKKSHIVYRANLNFEVVKKYLKRLMDADLITYSNAENRQFKTTTKGEEYLRQYRTLTSLAPATC